MASHPAPSRLRAAALAIAMAAAAPAAAQSLVIEPQFENAGHFHEGIAPAMQGGLWGFIDVGGAWVVEPQFEGVLAGADRRFGVMSGGRWGYIDPGGRLAIPMRYAEARPFSDGLAAVSPDGRRWVQIDLEGKVERKGDYQFLKITNTARGYAAGLDVERTWRLMRRGEAWPLEIGFWSSAENRIMSPDEMWSFSENIAVARFGDGFAYVVNDVYGHRVVTLLGGGVWMEETARYRDARPFSEGLAAVSPDGSSWGYVDREGRMAIPPRFEGAREFSEGVAPVRVGGLWGYADTSGRIIFQPRYDRAYSFREEYASTRLGDLRGFVRLRDDGTVEEAIPPSFEDVFSFQEGLAPVKIDGRWGYVAAEGVSPRVVRPIVGSASVVEVKP